MNNEQTSVEALLADESFLDYCNGDPEAKKSWEQQLVLNPDLEKTVKEAKKLYELLKAELTDVSKETQKFKHLIDENQQNTTTPVLPIKPKRRIWIAAAAVASALIATGLLLNDSQEKNSSITKTKEVSKPMQADAAPGKNTATLILADGSTIVLDSAGNGEITNQGNARIIKLQDGQVIYKNAGNATAEVVYNTMRTPKGGQYKLVLPDGSVAWLNAASSIYYPTAFIGNERKVEITGEVYFEIVPSRDVANGEFLKPFIVEKDGMQVKVLGTHFNINAYNDEADIKTTLLEGSVKVAAAKTAKTQEVKLIPRQQARLNNKGDISVVSNVNTDEVMAWKNGLFDFNNADIKTIMRQLARWYDLEVSYEGAVPQREFSGKITRNTNVSNVLKILEQSNIHFKLENNRIIVMP